MALTAFCSLNVGSVIRTIIYNGFDLAECINNVCGVSTHFRNPKSVQSTCQRVRNGVD
jgi:hypothetical protein